MQALVLLIAVASLLPPITSQTCKLLEQSLDPLQKGPDDVTVRRVELNGTDNASCLNTNREQDSPPCGTIEFSLQPTLNVENRSETENLTIYVGAGIYRPANEDAIAIIDSRNVQLIGAGVGQTVFLCGRYGEEDTACSYMNFQIRNSKYVYVSNITFTRCGPITSAVYISSSDYVVVKDCQFRDNISPPLLVQNTSPFVLYRTTFTNNHPQELNESVTSDTCYFSGGVKYFFLDNRTSSGGLSHYSENEPTLLYIERCVFVDNNARPDDTVSLPRQSEGYGHGAAANIRLSNSSNGQVCIKSCEFEDNQAEAQAGAVGLTVGGPSTRNNIELLNCTFFNNSCTLDRCTGGAIGIDFFADTAFNEILIKESKFIRNYARDGMGGAISLSTTVNVVTEDGLSDTLLLEGCLFSQNQAFYDGTAVGVFSLTHTDQVGLPVNITDCHFQNNSATRGSADSTALTAYRVLLTFNGNSSFVNNFGGGMLLLGSRMDVQGEVNLDGNFAVFGAGIAMTGRSLLLLFEGAVLSFTNNVAVDEGAGLYVEYTSSDFVLAILNRGCFIQYFSQLIDVPPSEWKATVRFVNNRAGIAGAAIYANDMSRCRWLGPTNYTTFIFNTPSDYNSPFIMENNTLDRSSSRDTRLATDASTFFATTDYGDSPMVGYGETVSFHLNSTDQFSNFRESVWTFRTEYQDQSLGALSTNEAVFEYVVPGRREMSDRDSVNISADFSLIGGQTSVSSVLLQVQGCHPGYMLQETTQTCVCDFSNGIIVQCDSANRYFYARDGYWVGVKSKSSALIYSTTVPGFLNCTRQGALPGCEIRYDSLEDQCAQGRQGTLCGDCKEGYGVTFDLRFCRRCGAGGIILFVFICIVTVIVSLLILFYNLPLPDELKGFVFFAQVIGLIYRNAPYLVGQNDSNTLFDVLINTLGFSLPFQLCPAENIPAFGIALLGFVPPLLAISVAIIYIFFAKRSKSLSERQSFNGFHFLYVFVYKYFLDTSFIFISCTLLGDNYVFLYQGTMECFEYPFVLLFTVGLLFLLGLGVILPSLLLNLLYRPGKHVQAADALTRGLKTRRRYRWYGVWDVWRRILFVAANLFISVTTRNIVLLIHCLLILMCLSIVCFVKPYKKAHINISEAVILFCLFGATLAILDDEDVNVGVNTSIVFAVLPYIYALVYIVYRVAKTLGKYIWKKAEKSESEKVKTRMDMCSSKYKRLKESKPYGMVMTVVDMMAEEERTTSRETTQTTEQSGRLSKGLSRERSCERDTEETGGQTVLDPSGIELLYRSGTVVAELREPLLEEQ